MQKTFEHWRYLSLILALAFLPALPGHGQSQRQYDRDYVPEYDVSDTRTQDYLRDVIALSSTLGSAHAIRLLCNGRDDQYWRAYMQELLGVEAPYRSRLRTSMVDAFNDGFQSENRRRNRCDEGAVSAEKTYASTGQRLARGLAEANLPRSAREDTADQ
ncbi:TIGR02301 family protein [Henriciella aquimarina]|uniref:TIGR02301 family protein n=1 Tax=Henriciella aquimarina TaxID=545261 RepID=UPI0009FBE51A|nr:TIGR02301 family protein [Henriciella aquimarina]